MLWTSLREGSLSGCIPEIFDTDKFSELMMVVEEVDGVVNRWRGEEKRYKIYLAIKGYLMEIVKANLMVYVAFETYLLVERGHLRTVFVTKM